MNPTARPSFGDTLTAAADHQELQRWRAAETVRAHVRVEADQADVLACLGLSGVTRPVTA